MLNLEGGVQPLYVVIACFLESEEEGISKAFVMWSELVPELDHAFSWDQYVCLTPELRKPVGDVVQNERAREWDRGVKRQSTYLTDSREFGEVFDYLLEHSLSNQYIIIQKQKKVIVFL